MIKKLALLAVFCTAVVVGWRFLKEAEEYFDLWECYVTYQE